MESVFDRLDSWYTDDLHAFVSTNGVRQSPPMGAGLHSSGVDDIRAGLDKWHEPVLGAGADFLDWAEKTLGLNARVLATEYNFEAVVKTTKCPSDLITLRHQRGGLKVVRLRVDQIFQKSAVTYGSWSFLYALSRAAVRFKLVAAPLGRGGFSASPAMLTSLFKEYDRKFSQKTFKAAGEKLVQSQRVADLFVKCLYGYNSKSELYETQPQGPVGSAFPGLDKNFIQSFKKVWVDGKIMKVCTRLLKQGKTEVAADVWKVVTPPLFKQMREEKESRRATQQILNPVSINEKNFRGVVSDMIDVVFTGVTTWDNVDIPYTVDADGKENSIQRERLNTALCLLQLGIGSRSRGIIAVNQIEQFDSPVIGDLTLMHSLDHHAALRVKNMTKDKPLEWKAYKAYKRMSEFDSDFTMEDAVDVVKNASCAEVIDKPFQYYLFDPVLHGISKGLKIDPDVCYSSASHHPREVYMQLFKTCRDYIHSKHPDTVLWDTYSTGGRKIWVVDAGDRLSENMHMVYKSVYPGMKAVCEKYLKRPEMCMESFGTHELRRLYVCYSFEFFGRGKTKEIAYAQYVLRHSSLTSTVFYTTLQFDMFMGSNSKSDMNEREQLMATVSVVQSKIENLKRKMIKVESDAVAQAKKLKGEHVVFVVDGESVLVSKLPHSRRGVSREFLVARGVLIGEEIRSRGVKVTQSNLRLLGVNSLIVSEVYAALTKSGK
jgi:hypothetical protein